ncbi:MAG: addiction module protein [bacterium]|nr:addiction module protein [bacterium]
MADLEALTQEALELPLDQRAQLAEKLLSSLDELTPTEVEQLWAQEAERRFAAYEAGEIESHPADEVHAEILKRIK